MVAATESAPVRPAKGWMEVFSLASVEGRTVPETASQLGVPPEQVRQMRDRTIAWLATNKPILSGLSRDEGMRIAEVAARERLEHLYGLAMQAWEKSKAGEVTTRQEGTMARTTRIVKRSHGNISYLLAASKIADMLQEVPIRYIPGWMEASAAADEELELEDTIAELRERLARHEQADLARGGASHPPVGDCSTSDPFEDPLTAQVLEGYDAMLDINETSAKMQEQFGLDGSAFANRFAPVQTAEEAFEDEFDFGAEDCTEEDGAEPCRAEKERPKATAETTFAEPVQHSAMPPTPQPSSVKRPHNRKARRARQRMLERARKRK